MKAGEGGGKGEFKNRQNNLLDLLRVVTPFISKENTVIKL